MIDGYKNWAAARLCAGLCLGLFLTLGCASNGVVDPWEKMNRGTFAFNEGADRYVIAPVATAWDVVIPEFVQTRIRNIFDHLRMPVILVNDVLQGKSVAVSDDLARLLINTVFGLGGLFDVASVADVPKNDEGFGQTFGYWGIGQGPYLVLPILGPSTVRSAVGLAMDTTAAPHSYFIPFWASATSTGVRILNLRAYYLEEIEQNRRDAFDYYIFMREAYLQNLKESVNDGPNATPATEDEDDLYYFDEE